MIDGGISIEASNGTTAPSEKLNVVICLRKNLVATVLLISLVKPLMRDAYCSTNSKNAKLFSVEANFIGLNESACKGYV